jgi:FkbM family methyltransferase
MRNKFKSALLARLRKDWRKRQTDNFDAYRFARERLSAAWWKRLAIKLGAMRIRYSFRMLTILRHANDLNWIYERLVDSESRDWLVSVMSFRALGSKRTKLASNNPAYWKNIKKIEHNLVKARSVQALSNGQNLDDFDLHPLGIPIVLRGRLGNVLYPFLLRQYRPEWGDRVFSVAPGDVVIDGGGCYGDTALYFANAIGSSGKVYSYEFDAENLDIYRHNMLVNPSLSRRVQLVENALWGTPGEEIHFRADGAGTRLDPHSGTSSNVNTVITDTIDALVERYGIAKVDFIKMDIEGAELEALKGARKTILRDRPKLAICLYHQLDHFWRIPQFIESLERSYEFRIQHFSIHAEETVLFADTRVHLR